MFGFPDLVEGSAKTLEAVKVELVVISDLWYHIDETIKNLETFLSCKWKDVNLDKMEDSIKIAKKTLTSKIKG
jgi:hypothetical protein